MRTVNLNEAEAHLSRLVDQAASGDAFIIAKDGKPLVKVVPFAMPAPVDKPRVGFLKGHVHIPDDFDRLGAGEIEALFDGQ
ncbi:MULTISPECIES: type II toxin-antitoxin system Phd/YefM family antitoxin [unclassified Methylobacterium]|uniref:type II toxin-antitoxin system Phd/YefM family antitoxin n=1 Tax=unclassified Methylobacterium TaxID=2615210 RepID=UPI001353494F|nr:type II toxin-antitoxin system prevent-host-death family antitoxin [Methylobacterium sp. 2A]MWV25618.1 type II toxin-antitoxin system prevent-host-death family antitoxin [Methylobacterium sp. 2A]